MGRKRRNKYLIITDFDNTLAQTMNPSPNNMGVLQAYEFAIQSVLGKEGIEIYRQIGGLQNRAPAELVADLLENGNKEVLIRNAKIFCIEQRPLLNKFALELKEAFFDWYSDIRIKNAISELIVLRKLSCYMDEIGASFPDERIWPEPCTGIFNFLKTIEDINRTNKVKIDLAILSSGHTPFIKKTFKVWGQKCPNILITDDDVRSMTVEPEKKVKPSKFLFDLVFLDWMKGYKLGWIDGVNIHFPNIIYIGDDLNKDGKLADNAGILFGWFNHDGKKDENFNGGFSFSDWSVVANLLKQERTLESLQKGKPLAKIFLPLMNGEVKSTR